MSLEENKALIRKMYETLNKRNLAITDEFIAPDYIDHTNQVRGPEGVKQFITQLLNSFSDFYVMIEDIIGEEDRVWVSLLYTMTHTGEYRGIAPTKKKITERSVYIYHIANGKVVEGKAVSDELDFLKQLGLIEYTETGKKLLTQNIS